MLRRSADCGPLATSYNRFNRWSQRGLWVQLPAALIDVGVVTRSTAGRSHVHQIQRDAFGAIGAFGASDRVVRGGWTTKIHALTDVSGPFLRAVAAARQRQRHQGYTRSARTRRTWLVTKATCVPSVRQAPRHSWALQPEANLSPRQKPTPWPALGRERLLPLERLPSHRYPLRQAPSQLPFSRSPRNCRRTVNKAEP